MKITTPYVPLKVSFFVHFTHIKKKCIIERERKMILSVLPSINVFFVIINIK